MNPECINCLQLGQCTETDVDKVMAHYYCVNWREAPAEVSAARIQAVNMFGRAGVLAVINKDLKDE